MTSIFWTRVLARAAVICALFFFLFAMPAFAQAGPATPGLLAQLLAWALAYPLSAIGLAIFILANLVTKLSAYPRAAGLVSVLKVVCDTISCIPHRDSPGLFTLPLLGRSKPPEDAEHMSLAVAAGRDGT